MKYTQQKTHRTRSILAPALLTTAISSQLAFAGFTWVDNSGIAGAGVGYTTGTTETFTVSAPGPAAAAGITMGFSSSVSGIVSTDLIPAIAGDTPHKKIWFENTEVVTAGTPMTVCFDFSHVIQSDGDGTLGNTTAATELRWYEDTPALTVDVNLNGGLDTFQNITGNPASPDTPNAGGTIWTVAQVVRNKGQNVTYNGFIDANTATYSSPTIATGDFGMINFVDTDQATSDLSYSQACYTFTPDTDMAAGTRFQWTFGGAAGEVLPVPEPSGSLLMMCSLPLLLLRKRK